MLKYENKGHVIEIRLPEECGYKEYSVECRYQFDKTKEKYLISMWLRKDGIDDTSEVPVDEESEQTDKEDFEETEKEGDEEE